MAVLAGVFVSFGGFSALSAAGGISAELRHEHPGISKILIGTYFPVALILIVGYGGELFTGNTMYFTNGWLHKKVSAYDVLRNWVLVFTGNFVGCVLSAYFFGYLVQLYEPEPWKSFVIGAAEHKVEPDFGVNFVKAIPANWLVCLAVCLNIASQDMASKIMACWVPVTAFAIPGFEHVIANQFFVTLGMMYGADISIRTFFYKSILAPLLGNIIGGGLMCGASLVFLHHVDGHVPIPVDHAGTKTDCSTIPRLEEEHIPDLVFKKLKNLLERAHISNHHRSSNPEGPSPIELEEKDRMV
eukprot:TRINITY_DN9235_c0_g1::TRINITY_DN9235_c0_g1_i1::g.13272::m.13272 TRINITY_DN9235_c0_g1::TRINITY_DN9235_c0_g1_i1::g.13272  ORF type:complete len:300 (+),score=68.42,sp/Q50568/FDHC_METTF/36.91/1e-39,Form_Nir_trans/PF01226.12/3e-68 TRINITY_DN9235_c0_g1_i1:226-1125(+)